MNDLVLKNCKFIHRLGEYYIGIENEKIAEISKNPLKADEELDIKGKLVLPGLVDPHVHFRDPGLTYKETFETGSLAAANGGFTTIIDMPNTIPPTNTAKNFKKKIKIGENKSIIDFGLHSGFNTLEEMKKIAKLKPTSFKVFMDLEEDENLDKMFKHASDINKHEPNVNSNWKPIITVHAENKRSILNNTLKMKKKKCIIGNRAIDYSYARPSEAENVSVKKAIDLAKKYCVKLHICHLSSKKALLIANSEKKSIELSLEATPHHLLLKSEDYDKYGTIAKTNPPLRPKGENIEISNLKDIDMIGTDHAPHTLEEKEKGVWNSNPGIPNLETTLPLLLTEVNKGNIDLKLIPKLLSENPAKIFNLKNKGIIDINKDADLVVVDLKKEGKFNLEKFYTQAKYTPFQNYEYKGIATMTIANGKIIMDNGIIVERNKGRYVCS